MGTATRPRPAKRPSKGPLSRCLQRADDGIRTRDPHLGKVMLYQLSHVRVSGRLRYQSPAETDNGISTGTDVRTHLEHDRTEGSEHHECARDLHRAEALAEQHPGSDRRDHRAAERQQRCTVMSRCRWAHVIKPWPTRPDSRPSRGSTANPRHGSRRDRRRQQHPRRDRDRSNTEHTCDQGDRSGHPGCAPASRGRNT